MQFSNRLLPHYVSFANLEVIELPRIANDARGYYDQLSKTNLWDHGLHGAGVWVEVEAGNRVSDTATMEINNPPWLGGGSFTWPIPNAWRVKNDVNETNIFCNTDQRFELYASGTAQLLKFGCVGERATNGVYRSWRTN